MSFIRMDGPRAHDRSVEDSRQQGEVRLGELLSRPKEKARTAKSAVRARCGAGAGRQRNIDRKEKDVGVSIRRLRDDRIRHGGDNSYRKGAGPAMGEGPRYLLAQ
jgi:hypothetical protein